MSRGVCWWGGWGGCWWGGWGVWGGESGGLCGLESVWGMREWGECVSVENLWGNACVGMRVWECVGGGAYVRV